MRFIRFKSLGISCCTVTKIRRIRRRWREREREREETREEERHKKKTD